MNAYTRERFIETKIMRHQKTGLLVAYSDDMKGLIVHGHTFEELNEKIPQTITAILEAEGHRVISVGQVDEVDASLVGFDPISMRFDIKEAA